jgi:hypothetical protein
MARQAILGNEKDITSFAWGGRVIRFRTSRHLLRYTEVLQWDAGYIVVKALYDNSPAEEEDYIDLIPILENLYIEPREFLQGVEGVCIENA